MSNNSISLAICNAWASFKILLESDWQFQIPHQQSQKYKKPAVKCPLGSLGTRLSIAILIQPTWSYGRQIYKLNSTLSETAFLHCFQQISGHNKYH